MHQRAHIYPLAHSLGMCIRQRANFKCAAQTNSHAADSAAWPIHVQFKQHRIIHARQDFVISAESAAPHKLMCVCFFVCV